MLAELRWPILERIPLFGDLAVSPHGISIALGFLIGAQFAFRRASLRGIARRPTARIPEIMQGLATRGAIGAIIGARFFYVVSNLELFPIERAVDVLSWFRIWEGGISLLGGIAGGIAAGLPYAWRNRFRVTLLLDSVAPGVAVGIFIGRIGDLVIGEHLGGPTDFILGWRCTGNLRDPLAPYPWPGPVEQGCYDVALHQTALYDFLAAGLVLAVIMLLERRPRFDGFFMVVFAVLYGGGRFLSDFIRPEKMVAGLTGSQLTSLAAIAVALSWVALFRPQRRT
ncbi:MAG TPA: prolipoprotein diacylglyceryl transferase family protein, partial [Egibacteraceae bacterium]|nr:prolipoprotein diacylglyceryl transferase family protein [Egibacteraceae bacterium]